MIGITAKSGWTFQSWDKPRGWLPSGRKVGINVYRFVLPWCVPKGCLSWSAFNAQRIVHFQSRCQQSWNSDRQQICKFPPSPSNFKFRSQSRTALTHSGVFKVYAVPLPTISIGLGIPLSGLDHKKKSIVHHDSLSCSPCRQLLARWSLHNVRTIPLQHTCLQVYSYIIEH